MRSASNVPRKRNSLLQKPMWDVSSHGHPELDVVIFCMFLIFVLSFLKVLLSFLFVLVGFAVLIHHGRILCLFWGSPRIVPLCRPVGFLIGHARIDDYAHHRKYPTLAHWGERLAGEKQRGPSFGAVFTQVCRTWLQHDQGVFRGHGVPGMVWGRACFIFSSLMSLLNDCNTFCLFVCLLVGQSVCWFTRFLSRHLATSWKLLLHRGCVPLLVLAEGLWDQQLRSGSYVHGFDLAGHAELH